MVHVSEPPATVEAAPAAGTPEPGRHGPRYRHGPGAGSRARARRTDGWLTAVAFAVVAAPFVYAVVRLLTAPTGHLDLPDDLALIDLHVRRALDWKQQVGVFDHNNWNHPGPTYFYLVSVVYRVLGDDPRSLFVGATLVNGLSAVACVAVVRRRTTPARALWAAVWVSLMAAALAASGTAATTYSESVLGALVSPWNPMVVLFPLLLVLLLCAGAVDRSGASLVGALAVGSYVVQTDIATLPLTAAVVAVAGGTWLATRVGDRWGSRGRADVPTASRWWARGLAVGGLVVTALLWVPPVVQQLTNHPGNLGLLYRFFTSGQPGQPLGASVRSAVAALATVVLGPGEIMRVILGGAPAHAALAYLVAAATVAVGVAVAVVGALQRRRFALGAGVAVVVGCAVTVVAVTHVVGFVFGYLVVWAAVLPVAACIGVGTVHLPARLSPGALARPVRIGLCAVALVAGAAACVRVAAVPPLARAGDPQVGRLAALVSPYLDPGGPVAVGDAGAGTARTQLLDTERFIGLVDILDRDGYRPTVNHIWRAEFGPDYVDERPQARTIGLSTWTASSPSLPGYVGRVGDMAVTVTDRDGRAVPAGSG